MASPSGPSLLRSLLRESSSYNSLLHFSKRETALFAKALGTPEDEEKERQALRTATDAALEQAQSLRTRLVEGWAELDERRSALQQKKDDMTKDNGGCDVKQSDKIKLNVGGEKITVRRRTFLHFQDTNLSKIFSGRWEKCLPRDAKGRIFLDFNPVVFRKIINHLVECIKAGPDSPPEAPAVPQDLQEVFHRTVHVLDLGEIFPSASDSDQAEDGDDECSEADDRSRDSGEEDNDDNDEDPMAETEMSTLDDSEPNQDGATDTHQEPGVESQTDEGATKPLLAWAVANVKLTGQEVAEAMIPLRNSLLNEACCLEVLAAQQRLMEKDLDDEMEFVQRFILVPANDIIQLNLSGKSLAVKRSTLRLCEDSALSREYDDATWTTQTMDLDSDSEEEGVFMDDNPYCFEKIVDMLRLISMHDPESHDPLPPPRIIPDEEAAFARLVHYYFPGCEQFITRAESDDEQHPDEHAGNDE